MLARRGRLIGCVAAVVVVFAIALFVRWWTAPIEFPRPQRPPEPADNPYDVYRSLAVYTAQMFQNNYMLAYAERQLSRSRARLEQPELARYLLRQVTPVRLEYRRYLRQPCMVIMEYSPFWRFPELDEFRRWAAIEAVDILLAVQEGDDARAVDNFQTILLLSEQIRRQGGVMHHIVGAGMQTTVTVQMAHVLHQLPAASCEQLVQAVREWQQYRTPPSQAVAVERDACLALLHDLYAGKWETTRVLLEDRPLARWHPRWLNLRQAAQESEQYYRRVQLELSKPRNLQQSLPEPRHPVTKRCWETDFQMLSRFATYSTCRVLLLGCAAGVRAYRLRHGAYPPTLSEAGVDDLNRDPFTGERFVYKPSSEGFLLYSVGEDGVDDGGKRVAEPGGTRGDVTLLPFSAKSATATTAQGEPVWLK